MITTPIAVRSGTLRCACIRFGCELPFVASPLKGPTRHAQKDPRIPVVASIAALALVCALPPATALTGPPAHAHRVTALAAPLDGEEPCPGGESKPCSASPEERDSVDKDRDAAKQDSAAAKQDIAAAKQAAQQCTAESKACLTDLIGPGRRAAPAVGAAFLALTCTTTAASSYAATPPEVPTPVGYEGTTPLASTQRAERWPRPEVRAPPYRTRAAGPELRTRVLGFRRRCSGCP
ncbi:hypothetical protein OG311_36145 [Streptomyces sp. NBC_01343]|uniref:hypothetical protein n=1 Tax=Streptomyces sp. NBC_01343 TaxID=2903832 RepID=UPI002E14B6F5|nr:hypothetical protein OG311_36145 [Streptomyces sp. NBC_01343]